MWLSNISFYYYNEEIPLQNEIIRNLLGDENVPDMWEIESNADLLLINSYELLNNIRPTVPTTVYLGGIHRKTVTAPLSTAVTQFLDESEHAVFVNLNSAINQNSDRFQKLLKSLENANVDVVWNVHEHFINTSSRIFQATNLDQESVLGELQEKLH